MSRLAFRPGWAFTAFMVFGVIVTGSLCAWQLNRHQTKQALKDEILAELDKPVLTNEDLTGPPASIHYRKASVEGVWGAPVRLTAGRTPMVSEQIAMPKAGYGVLQPLTLDSGHTLLVDRGWIPRDGAEAAVAELDPPGTPVTQVGQLRPIDGDPVEGPLPGRDALPEMWPPGSWIAIHERLPEPRIDAILLAGEPILAGEGANPGKLPIDGYKPLPKMRDSLSYAGQWALFGTILFIVWVGFGVHRGRQALRPERAPTERSPSDGGPTPG